MTIIKNNTEKVVVVSHRSFVKDIPIGESVTLTDEELSGDFQVSFAYFSLKSEQIEVDFGVNQGKYRRRVSMYYKNESTFPITSYVNIEGCTDLVLQNASTILGILLLFKQVRLNRILCKSGNQDLNVRCAFTCEQDKKRCLKMLYFSVLFTLPVAFLLLVGGIYSIFTEKIWIALFEIVLAVFPICDLISLINMRKWHVKN